MFGDWFEETTNAGQEIEELPENATTDSQVGAFGEMLWTRPEDSEDKAS